MTNVMCKVIAARVGRRQWRTACATLLLFAANAAASDADINDDCVIDTNDLIQILGRWGPCEPPCPEDVDGDGLVGVTDMIAVIANWAPTIGPETRPVFRAQHLLAASLTRFPAIDDFDGDGVADLIWHEWGITPTPIIAYGNGNGRFANGVAIGNEWGSRFLVPGDFDDDGDVDVLVDGFPAIVMLTNDGMGSFTPVDLPNAALDLRRANFDGDEIDELLVVSIDDMLEIHRGNTPLDVIFNPTIAVLGPEPVRLVVADVDADGRDDLVQALDTGEIEWWRSDGKGGFDPPAPIASLSVAVQLHVGDLDADGLLDVLAADDYAGPARIFLNAGDGFVEADPLDASSPYALGDVDLDGDADVIAGSFERRLHRNLGDATFDESVLLGAGASNEPMLFTDVTGDIAPDLILASDSRYMDVLTNDGSGNFGRAYSSAGDIIELVDLNGDGTLDIFGATVEATGVIPLIGDGIGSFEPLPIVGPGFHYGSAATGDFDGDGAIDFVLGSIDWIGDPLPSVAVHLAADDFEPSSQFTLALNEDLRSLATFDVDANGAPDVIMGMQTITVILMNDGTGALSYQNGNCVDHGAYDIAVADIDGNGDEEWVLLGGGAVSIAHPDAFGGPCLEVDTLPLSITTRHVVAFDFDGDGDDDLAVSGNGDEVAILRSDDGDLSLVTTLLHAASPTGLASGDVDQDGNADLIAVQPGYANIWFGDGVGGFGNVARVPCAEFGGGAAVADLDGDGAPDLACGRTQLHVHLNRFLDCDD